MKKHKNTENQIIQSFKIYILKTNITMAIRSKRTKWKNTEHIWKR